MANGMIRVTLIGNLGKDPEIKHTGGGTAVCNLRVACTEKDKNKEGKWEDHTEWVGVVVFGKLAENVSQYCSKGKQIYVGGRQRTREWTDKDGQKRTSVEVIANTVLFLGGGERTEDAAPRSEKPKPAGADDPPPLYDDDIPL